jgi:predicted nucleotidyltransferase
VPTKFQLLLQDITERLKGLSEKVAGVEGLVALWLFGSFVRSEVTPISDVDLAYLPDERLTGDALERFEQPSL